MASRIRSFPIIGHRGAPQLIPPGNTLESLRKAIEVGADMLEVDVRRTSDDVLVLDHEAMRLTDGRDTPLHTRSYKEWQIQAAETHSPLPTLAEAFALASAASVGLMLDVRDPGIEALLARAIRKSRFPLDSLLVAIADNASRRILRGLDPRIPLSHALDEGKPPDAKLLATIDTDAVTWHGSRVTPAIVRVLNQREIQVYAGPADLAEEMRRLRNDCRVDGILTNAPDLLCKL